MFKKKQTISATNEKISDLEKRFEEFKEKTNSHIAELIVMYNRRKKDEK